MNTATEKVLLHGEISSGGYKTNLQLKARKTENANGSPHYSEWEIVGDKLFGLTDGEYQIHVDSGPTVKVRVLDGQFHFA